MLANPIAIALQIMASMKWRLQIPDLEGAFLRGSRGCRVEGVQAGSVTEAIKPCTDEQMLLEFGVPVFPGWCRGLRISRFHPCLFITCR